MGIGRYSAFSVVISCDKCHFGKIETKNKWFLFLLIFIELAHDCIGNTFITVDNNKQLKVYASLDIKVGEIIYNNYTASLYVSFDGINVCMRGSVSVCSK